MFQHILVPLDGSGRAENALPIAARIARATGGSLLLLRVAPLLTVPKDVFQREYQRVSAYLGDKKHAEELQGIPVETHVVVGSVPQQILSSIESANIDLVVMCSRGETGLKRWAWGSVAQKVIRYSRASVLVLRESSGILNNQHPAGQRPLRLLVALDGSALAETTLVPAATLATALSMPEKGEFHLVQVVPLPEPSNAAEALSEARQLDLSVAQTYLQSAVESLQGKENLTITTSVVVCPDVADALIRTAEDGLPATEEMGSNNPCDVIALATHGRSGIERWVLGSIAERILDGTRLPLLVVHPAWRSERPDIEPASLLT
ncbi:MAG: universal stress protein [Ktedonobacteraceae bacterium]